MTEDEVRAAAERLVQFHERFAPLFGKEQAQNHAYTYVKGLMVCPERKSIEPIALNVGDGQVSALQKFVNIAPWDHSDVQAEIQSDFADELVPTAADSPIGVVGVIDESGFAKKGHHSAGVARQHNGRLGKEDNGQVGVYLVGVTPGGSAMLDHQLYLPESWCQDTQECRDRRQKVHIPEAVSFQTKPQIAAGLIRQTVAVDLVDLDWITADEEYGKNGEFLDEVERLELRYVVEVPVTTTVWTEDPASCVPEYGGRGRVPTLPSREKVASVVAVASDLDGQAWRPCGSARGPRVRWPSSSPRFGSGRCVTARPDHRSGCWCGGRWRWCPRSSTTSAMPTPRRRWGCWRKWPARGTRSRIISRTPRATWGWRSTRRGRGSGGTIT
jgi:SRSO17 transposase